jgi:hypothetical protein
MEAPPMDTKSWNLFISYSLEEENKVNLKSYSYLQTGTMDKAQNDSIKFCLTLLSKYFKLKYLYIH